jgi:hypothetical protein
MIKTLDELAKQYGISRAAIDEIALSFDDVIPQPDGEWFEVKRSSVHGWGVFECHYPVTLFKNGLRTLAGRYMNHGDEVTGYLRAEGRDVIYYPFWTEGEHFMDYEECINLQRACAQHE